MDNRYIDALASGGFMEAVSQSNLNGILNNELLLAHVMAEIFSQTKRYGLTLRLYYEATVLVDENMNESQVLVPSVNWQFYTSQDKAGGFKKGERVKSSLLEEHFFLPDEASIFFERIQSKAQSVKMSDNCNLSAREIDDLSTDFLFYKKTNKITGYILDKNKEREVFFKNNVFQLGGVYSFLNKFILDSSINNSIEARKNNSGVENEMVPVKAKLKV